MNGEQFIYWLQGYLEMSGAKTLGEKEVQILKDHLALVFEKKTPNYDFADMLKKSQQTICYVNTHPNLSAAAVTVSEDVSLDSLPPLSC